MVRIKNPLSNEHHLRIFPNPATGFEFTIEMQKIPGNKSLEIYSITGELIFRQELGDVSMYLLNLGKEIKTGLYMLKIVTP